MLLHFHDVSVATLVEFFHHLTGKDYLLEGGWMDRLDLSVERRLSVDEAEASFVSTLEPLGYHFTTEGKTVRITVTPIPAVRVEGTVASLATEPLTRGARESFDAVCSSTGSWIRIRAPERACGWSWVRLLPEAGLVYLPWIRRVRRIDETTWTKGEQFGLPISVRDLFDVVCETRTVSPERARFVTVDRRTATEVGRDEVRMGGLIQSVDKLGCSDQAGTPQAQS